jgi:hypothetical protein
MNVRYISRSRLQQLPVPKLDRYRPEAADGESIGHSYDIVTDMSTDWIVVADHDARAETVRECRVMDADTRDRCRRIVLRQREVQRVMFAAQSEAIEALMRTVEAIQQLQAEMLPLYETLNGVDDIVEGE